MLSLLAVSAHGHPQEQEEEERPLLLRRQTEDERRGRCQIASLERATSMNKECGR